MCTAVHLTLQEEHFLWPFWAALGASVLLSLEPPWHLNPSCLSMLVVKQGNCRQSAQSHHRCNIIAPAVHNDMQSWLP